MAAPVAPGEVIAQGKYRVEHLLGEGGMGIVVVATHIGFDDRVAIKLLRPEVAANAEVVQRFLREGRAARKIRGEHVVQVMDVGTLETGAPYMVMEYLEGEDLSDRLRRTGPLSYPEAVELVLQACEAIAEAHVIGIVHRDLKPANLFSVARRGGEPCIKVLDFGISKLSGTAGGTSAALTRTTATMGSPLYMSPEQLHSSRDVDARSDIWALGVILYELLTGNHPFVAEDLPRLCVQIMAHPPAPLSPEIPAPVAAAILRCLEKDPNRRFAHVGELAFALAPVCNERARLSVDRIASIVASTGVPSGGASRPSFPDGVRPPPTPWGAAGSGAPAISAAAAPRSAATTAGAAVISTSSMQGTRPAQRGGMGNVLLGAGVALALVAVVGGIGLFAMKGLGHGAASPPSATTTTTAPSVPASPAAPDPPPAPSNVASTAAAASAAPTTSASIAASAPPPNPAAPAAKPVPAAPPVVANPPPRPAAPPVPKPKPTVDDTL